MKFKIGDLVQPIDDLDYFDAEARSNGSTRRYIDFLKKGGTATVIDIDGRSVRLNSDEIDDTSNWFRHEILQHADKLIVQIKQESQRL